MPGRACKASEHLLNIRGIQQAPAQGGEAGDDVSSAYKIGAFGKSSTPCVKIIVRGKELLILIKSFSKNFRTPFYSSFTASIECFCINRFIYL